MIETQPEKKLVSRGLYIQVLGKKVGLWLSSAICLSVSVLSFAYIVVCKDVSLSWFSLVVVLLGVFSITSVKFANNALDVEPVQPITAHTAHLLPAQKTLLRSSNLPATLQQSELLRATQSRQETPQEQLLRATTGAE